MSLYTVYCECSFFKSEQNKKLIYHQPWWYFQQQIPGIQPIDMSIWIVQMTARIYGWRPSNWNIIWYSIQSARVKQCEYSCFHSLQLFSLLLVYSSFNIQYQRTGIGSLHSLWKIELIKSIRCLSVPYGKYWSVRFSKVLFLFFLSSKKLECF